MDELKKLARPYAEDDDDFEEEFELEERPRASRASTAARPAPRTSSYDEVLEDLNAGSSRSAAPASTSRRESGNSKVLVPTVFTTAPAVKKEFEKTEYAQRLKATGVILSYICPLMYMNNPLCKTMNVITSSNKLRTYTTARYYTEAQILDIITKGGN